MFAKVFNQILDSSIAENHIIRHVFMDFLVLANRDGEVDMTSQAISRRTNVPLDVVVMAIANLSQPDASSRSDLEEGRRLVLLDAHRDWGWRIVNYPAYRDMRDDEARKAYFRDRKRHQRAQNVTLVLDSPKKSKKVTYTEVEVDTEALSTLARFTSSDIESIYQLYPRKVGKGAALKAIEKALERIEGDRPAEWVAKRVKLYAESTAGQNGAFTPHPATWFNQSRYLDDPKEWEKVSLR